MEQGTLAEFDEGGDEADRPAEEAALVELRKRTLFHGFSR